MRKILMTLVASAALAFGIAGQASARDYHHGHGNYNHSRHYHGGYHGHYNHYRPQYYGGYYGYARPYYSGYGGYYYAPPPPPPPVYYGGYGYGVGYSQPGFGFYIGR